MWSSAEVSVAPPEPRALVYLLCSPGRKGRLRSIKVIHQRKEAISWVPASVGAGQQPYGIGAPLASVCGLWALISRQIQVGPTPWKQSDVPCLSACQFPPFIAVVVRKPKENASRNDHIELSSSVKYPGWQRISNRAHLHRVLGAEADMALPGFPTTASTPPLH